MSRAHHFLWPHKYQAHTELRDEWAVTSAGGNRRVCVLLPECGALSQQVCKARWKSCSTKKVTAAECVRPLAIEECQLPDWQNDRYGWGAAGNPRWL